MLIVGIAVITVLCGMITGEFKSKGQQNLDYIIVLGAQVRESGPSVVLQYRLDAAIDYLNKNPDTICIVSGGQGVNEPFSEAEGMAKYLLENGIEMDRILLEEMSKNGFHRLSLGVQSSCSSILHQHLRSNSSKTLISSWLTKAWNKGIKKINLDFMYGLDKQDKTTIRRDLELIKQLKPQQITSRSYTYTHR